MAELNWFDILIVSIVVFSTLFAFITGFIKTFFSFLTWLGALIATIYAFPYSGRFFEENMTNEMVVSAIVVIVIFIGFFTIFLLINRRFVRLFRRARHGVMDRSLGFAFGMLRGAFIVCVIFFSLLMTSKLLTSELPTFVREAKTHNILKLATKQMISLLPEEVMFSLSEKIEDNYTNISAILEKDLDVEQQETAIELTDSQHKIMSRITKALPKNELIKLQEKYKDSSGELSHKQKAEVYQDIILTYQRLKGEGGIKSTTAVPAKDVKRLLTILQKSTASSPVIMDAETGYKKINIQQFNRLINNIE